MNAWIWSAGAALVLVAVGWYFGLGGLAKVGRAATGALGDWAAGAREWLRRPGNKLRAVCGALALVSLCAGLQSWQRGNVIIQQRADYVRLERDTGEQIGALRGDLALRDQAIARFTELARRQMELLEVARQEARDAMVEAERAKVEAAEARKRFDQRFDERPPECEAALQVMAKACPTLSDY